LHHFELIKHYFPGLSDSQQSHFEQLFPLYQDWNNKINVISRKDMEEFYLRHVLHSLAIARSINFVPGSLIIDAGTGGGFPGIPLAILFPEAKFLLVDSIGKKIKVVNEVITVLKLENAEGIKERVENLKMSADFVVSRAVTRMKSFYYWVRPLISSTNRNSLNNGILYLKGGDLEEEMNELGKSYQEWEISEFFEEAFFDTKKIVYVPVSR